LYHGTGSDPEKDYRNMVDLIVDSAMERFGIR
jgi:hypothetical protein